MYTGTYYINKRPVVKAKQLKIGFSCCVCYRVYVCARVYVRVYVCPSVRMYVCVCVCCRLYGEWQQGNMTMINRNMTTTPPEVGVMG